ncbi:hypothetical protein Tco_1571376 [Tanacetum coccineum]
MIVYLISYGDKAEETVDVVVDVPSGCRSSKKKKNKSKNIVGDDSGASGSQDGACKIKSRRTSMKVIDACTVASSAKSYLESIMLHAHVTWFPQRRLVDNISTFDRSLVDIAHDYAYLKSRRLKVQLGASSMPARIELEAQPGNNSSWRTASSCQLFTRSSPRFKAELKLDGTVAVMVVEEAVALSTKSWPYLLEIITKKDEDIEGLLAIRLILTLLHLLPRRSHD